MTVTVVFILVAVLIAFIVPAAIAHGRRVDVVWSEAATALKLGFQPSGLFQRCRITGTMSGLIITLDTHTRRSGRRQKTHTRLDVRFPLSLGLGLRMARSGFASGVSQFPGGSDTEVGEKTFDGSIAGKGEDSDLVRAFFTTARRARIHRLLSNFTEAVIDDHGMRWQKRGVMTDADEIVRIVRRFQGVAWHLIEDRQRDRVLSDALEAAGFGRPGEALALLQTCVMGEDVANPDDVEEDIVRGHLFHLAGRDVEAQAAFATAADKAPEDEEAQRWAQRMLQSRAGPAPAFDAKEHDETLTVAALCGAVFRPEGTSFEVNRRFDRQFQGSPVTWKGVLREVESYGVDFVFEGRDRCKGLFEVTQSDAVPVGRREVMAVVELQDEVAAALATRIGETLHFRGTLFRIDALLRNVYLISGEVTL